MNKKRTILRFESPKYYVDSNHYGYSMENELDEMKVKGNIMFTCRIREPLRPLKK